MLGVMLILLFKCLPFFCPLRCIAFHFLCAGKGQRESYTCRHGMLHLRTNYSCLSVWLGTYLEMFDLFIHLPRLVGTRRVVNE